LQFSLVERDRRRHALLGAHQAEVQGLCVEVDMSELHEEIETDQGLDIEAVQAPDDADFQVGQALTLSRYPVQAIAIGAER
jgi:hypothetical protein